MARYLFLALARRRALPRGCRLFGHSHARRRRKRTNRLGEAGPGMLDQKGDGATVRAATETMIELFGGTNGKRWAFFVMKRAKRSEEHTSELQSLMRISYAVFCLKKQTTINIIQHKY